MKDKKCSTDKFQGKSNEQVILDVIRELRNDPKKYKRLRKEMSLAKTDKQRVRTLLHFATNERELAALLPVTAAGVQAAAWTTVTVTTIFILEDSAY